MKSRFISGKTKKLKAVMLFTALILLTVFLYSFINPGNIPVSPPPVSNGNFLIGVIQSYDDPNHINYNAAGLNLTHKYVSTAEPGPFPRDPIRSTPFGGVMSNDYLYSDVNLQGIHDALDGISGSRILWHRPKIEWLAYGQSSIYEAEGSAMDTGTWFYAFNVHNGQVEEEGGHKVLYCGIPANGQNAGIVLSRLKANTEQCRAAYGASINQWQADNECTWFVKPRIKIPASVAMNYPYTEVCKIYVKNQDGSDKISPVTIIAGYFLDENNYYDGSYLEEFNFDYPSHGSPRGITFPGALGDKWWYKARGEKDENLVENHADIQVWWSDNCAMWIDYVKVENDVADKLLKGYYDDPAHPENQWIKNEVDAVKDYPNSNEPAVYNFYIELSEFNNIPCMAYVNQKIEQYSDGKIGLMAELLWGYQYHMPYEKRGTIVSPEKIKSMFYDKTGFNQVFLGDPYSITAAFPDGCYGYHEQQYSRIPESLPIYSGTDVMAVAIPPAEYDAWLQSHLDTLCGFYEGGYDDIGLPLKYSGNFRYQMKRGHEVSKLCDIPFIPMLQAHQWMGETEVDREPTNEELNLMTNLAVAYGAKGIIYWWWLSSHDDSCSHNYGLMEPYPNHQQPRQTNVYGQPKWENFLAITNRLNTWGPALISFNNTDRHTYIYRLDDERNACLYNTYFNDVVSYEHGDQPPFNECREDSPEPYSSPAGWKYECKENRYLQVSTFNMIPNQQVQYFMIVNRRCSPLDPVNQNDGERFVSVLFDQNSNYFSGAKNWKITDVADTRWSVTFDKTANAYVDLNTFSPGEGKLYKVEPVITKGGNLVADEYVSGDVICEDTVFTNGFNVTVENNSSISFTDTSNFVIQGGSFTMGNSLYNGVPNITCGAASGNTWNGFVFDSCEVRIYNSTFSGFTSDTSYPLTMIDCPLIDIQNNVFSNSENSTLGAINILYYDINSIDNVYIGNNTFALTNSVVPAVNILSYAGITTPLIIENNTFSSITDNSTAILLSGITGGAVKQNTITNFKTGLNLLSSSIDVYENTISSNLESSIGILAVSGSELKMNPSGELQLGGINNISCTGTGSSNIKVDNSYFNMDGGENIFNISELNTSYHMNGWFYAFLQVPTEARENCFKVNSQPQAPPIENLTWGEGGSDIDFTFSPYLSNCIPEGCQEYYIVDLGGGLYDTICIGGIGSGMLDNNEHELTTGGVSGKTTPSFGHPSLSRRGAFVLNPKQAYDSLCIYMRYRNYANAKNKCYELINNYPDSIQSINAINKLFLAVTATDTTQLGINQLKTYFETLILNHSGNVPLVKRCNYFVQKCKVRMRNYSSALTGFQQIITQNPASYEGLVARWDYMATSLLMHGGGTGGISDFGIEISDLEEKAFEAYEEAEEIDMPGDDKTPFTKEEKKSIRNAVNDALGIAKENNDKRLEILKEKSEIGDVNAKRELEHINKMKEVVKTQKPRNIIEHIKIINSDIQKIFGGKSSNNKSQQNNIPVVYRLAQNYPNPFNPITTIKYELPKDSKVKLVVYDLLGREVKTLVNNEIKSAGYYKIEFNMQNYASGVYFYRIEADDSKGNKFIDAKKMVLVK